MSSKNISPVLDTGHLSTCLSIQLKTGEVGLGGEKVGNKESSGLKLDLRKG